MNEERSEAERREAMVLFERLLADRSVVRDFFDEGSALVAALTKNGHDTRTTQRVLHTLKGNSAIFGLGSLSTLCHEIETRVVEERRTPSDGELVQLRERWTAAAASAERWLGARRDVIEIDIAQQQELERATRGSMPRQGLVRMIEALKLEPTSRRLEHFADQADRIADRLGKKIAVTVAGNGLRIDSKTWSSFWGAFIHAVRNAVDHGIEPAADREALGKPLEGHIALESRIENGQFVVEIRDDGRGIDWTRVADRARANGLPHATRADLEAALFHGGISTAATVTDISGRGLGMGALQEAAAALGGEIRIESTTGQGTTIRLVLAQPVMEQVA